MPSRVISLFKYEPERKRLIVTFVTGRVYDIWMGQPTSPRRSKKPRPKARISMPRFAIITAIAN